MHSLFLIGASALAVATSSCGHRASQPADAAEVDATEPSYDMAAGDAAESDGAPALFSMEGRTWRIATVDHVAMAPVYPSLTLDPDGVPFVVYTKRDGEDTFPAASHREGAGWSAPETIERTAGASLGKRPSINVDAARTVHVLSYDETNERARYARKPVGEPWSSQDVYQADLDAGDQSVLARDGQGRLHAAFLQFGDYRFVYGLEQADIWQFELLCDQGAPVKAYAIALGVSADGEAHALYSDGNLLRHARGGAGSWQHELVDDPQGEGDFHYPVVAVIGEQAHVSYLRWLHDDAEIRVARSGAAGWEVDVVDTGLGISYTTGIAVLPCGTEVIAYGRNYGSGTSGLWFAYHHPGEAWVLSLVDGDAVASGIDLAAASSGVLHLIYTDEGEYALRHAELPLP